MASGRQAAAARDCRLPSYRGCCRRAHPTRGSLFARLFNRREGRRERPTARAEPETARVCDASGVGPSWSTVRGDQPRSMAGSGTVSPWSCGCSGSIPIPSSPPGSQGRPDPGRAAPAATALLPIPVTLQPRSHSCFVSGVDVVSYSPSAEFNKSRGTHPHPKTLCLKAPVLKGCLERAVGSWVRVGGVWPQR